MKPGMNDIDGVTTHLQELNRSRCLLMRREEPNERLLVKKLHSFHSFQLTSTGDLLNMSRTIKQY